MTDDQAEMIAKAIRSIGEGDRELGGLEGLAVSLGGQFLRHPVGPALEAIAEVIPPALGQIADALDRIAGALEDLQGVVSPKETTKP